MPHRTKGLGIPILHCTVIEEDIIKEQYFQSEAHSKAVKLDK